VILLIFCRVQNGCLLNIKLSLVNKHLLIVYSSRQERTFVFFQNTSDVVTNWLVKPIEVDDVPILMLGLWGNRPDRYGDFELRRFADEITTYLQQLPDIDA